MKKLIFSIFFSFVDVFIIILWEQACGPARWCLSLMHQFVTPAASIQEDVRTTENAAWKWYPTLFRTPDTHSPPMGYRTPYPRRYVNVDFRIEHSGLWISCRFLSVFFPYHIKFVQKTQNWLCNTYSTEIHWRHVRCIVYTEEWALSTRTTSKARSMALLTEFKKKSKYKRQTADCTYLFEKWSANLKHGAWLTLVDPEIIILKQFLFWIQFMCAHLSITVSCH